MSSYRTNIQIAIKGITSKSIWKKSSGIILKGLKNVRAEWKYIGFSTGIQLAVESYVKQDEIYDADPKRMAENMLHHPGIQENVSISVADALAMTAAHGVAQTKMGKFALMGIVGASSSLGVGVGLSGSQSKERVLFDTAWTIGIDSLQIMLDLHVLHKFQAMALKAKNPKLKLAGYAIVFVGQVASYYGYAHATHYFDPQIEKEGELMIVPIHLASAD